jgi:hypothetical protein
MVIEIGSRYLISNRTFHVLLMAMSPEVLSFLLEAVTIQLRNCNPVEVCLKEKYYFIMYFQVH